MMGLGEASHWFSATVRLLASLFFLHAFFKKVCSFVGVRFFMLFDDLGFSDDFCEGFLFTPSFF
jgi:hypothetical protein